LVQFLKCELHRLSRDFRVILTTIFYSLKRKGQEKMLEPVPFVFLDSLYLSHWLDPLLWLYVPATWNELSVFHDKISRSCMEVDLLFTTPFPDLG